MAMGCITTMEVTPPKISPRSVLRSEAKQAALPAQAELGMVAPDHRPALLPAHHLSPLATQIPLHRQLPDLRVQVPDLRSCSPRLRSAPFAKTSFMPFHRPLFPGAHLVRADLVPRGDLLDRLVPAQRLQRYLGLELPAERSPCANRVSLLQSVEYTLATCSDFPGTTSHVPCTYQKDKPCSVRVDSLTRSLNSFSTVASTTFSAQIRALQSSPHWHWKRTMNAT